jgi:hypothetical protein
MSRISHSDYCPLGNSGDREDCPDCEAEYQRQKAYYGSLYRGQQAYTREEIQDSLSDPTEYAKRTALLERT